jgi:Asp-tRNA(Asn)/Glu-tRNA(Gln) amidotransferase C subunit
MSYLKPSPSSAPIDPETVTLLAQLAGFTVPPEDVQPLADALRNQLASMETLEELDLTDVNPSLEFDPRWPT